MHSIRKKLQFKSIEFHGILSIFAIMLKSKVWLLLGLLIVPNLIIGQPFPPGGPGAPVPLPGVILVFLAGLALGVFKLSRKKPQ